MRSNLPRARRAIGRNGARSWRQRFQRGLHSGKHARDGYASIIPWICASNAGQDDYGTGTPDVYEYANANAPVPRESTVNQFFPESQFGLVASSTGAVKRRRRSSTAMRSANRVPLGKSDGKDGQFKGKHGNDEPGNPFPFVRDDGKRDEPGEEHRQVASHRMSTPGS